MRSSVEYAFFLHSFSAASGLAALLYLPVSGSPHPPGRPRYYSSPGLPLFGGEKIFFSPVRPKNK